MRNRSNMSGAFASDTRIEPSVTRLTHGVLVAIILEGDEIKRETRGDVCNP
jgi:hypothetical protein